MRQLKNLCLLLPAATYFATQAASGAEAGKIALIQYNADERFGRYEENLAALTHFADQAVAHQANIIVFPEGSAYGYASPGQNWCAPTSTDPSCLSVTSAAETVPNGRTTVYWENYAATHHVYVLFNLPEVDGQRFFNTSVIIGPQGFVAKYHKRELYWADKLYAEAGTSRLIINTPYGKLGLLICMDVTYPGELEDYRTAGADAAILMMDWDDDPNGEFAASRFLTGRAATAQLDIYASDSAAWDGTGKYSATGGPRTRGGLPGSAIGLNGISYHLLNY